MSLFGLLIFPQHFLELRDHRLVDRIRDPLVVVQPGIDQGFITPRQRSEGSSQVGISQRAVSTRDAGKCIAQAHDQLLALIQKLLRNFYFRKQRALVEFSKIARLLMSACLLQINAIRRAVKRDLAMLAAALRANASMHRGTEPLLLALLTDCTAHELWSPF